jgi:uncharacterized protein (DUF433 family)
MIYQILDMLGSGLAIEQITGAHYFPFLTREDMLACVNYAALIIGGDDMRDFD